MNKSTPTIARNKNDQKQLKDSGSISDTFKTKHTALSLDADATDEKSIQNWLPTDKYKLETTVCGLITKQMLLNPEKTAIIDGEQRIDYQTLLEKAAQVAGTLEVLAVKPQSLVGVCIERSWELIATLIGVMQAGCAYVPLDPAYPRERIEYMLSHSNAAAAIVDTNTTASLCNPVEKVIRMDALETHKNYTIKASTNDLAYVIYTSGSTGQPKGVAVAHRNVIELRLSMQELFTKEDLQGMLAAASVCFDTSVMEIMGTLFLGGTLILAKNALDINKIPASNEIRTCVMVPSAVQALLTTERLPQNVTCLVFGGEALKQSLVRQVYDLHPHLRVLNAYGPTEDTVYSTIAEIPAQVETITIGTSVPNILDENLQPVSQGVAGELYLAGSKLAKGYLYDEAKTKERFIKVAPTNTITHDRLYKTGDLCRRTAEGAIEFLGRADQQVKIRGYRIELEEIENALEAMPEIEAAAAVAIEGATGQKMLVAYVVRKNKSVTDTAIKSFLLDRLPAYMVPTVIRYLTALPLLPNDKLDRAKLMHLEQEVQSEQELKAAKNVHKLAERLFLSSEEKSKGIQTIITSELATILNLGDPQGVLSDRSFTDQGLDSLSILEFGSRLTNLFHQKISAEVLLKYDSASALTHYILSLNEGASEQASNEVATHNTSDTLASFQTHIQSSHPTFQAAKANAWSATDKSKLVQEVMQMVNDDRRNPYSKVLRTGSATKGIVGDAYNDEVQEAIIWTTNLYLGLNRDPAVMKQASLALDSFGTGMGTSAAASGMTDQHLEFEKEFAELTGKPAACLFPTGYTANVGAIAGLLGKHDVVIIDQLCHASIVDGARLCGATIRTFQHNNTADLEAVLQSEISPYRTVLVVLEGVYSMGEGAAPVAEIVRAAKKYDALVLVDEAHSFGFYGKNGAGICAAQGVTEEVDFIMTTLSKALGSLGGVVSASREHIDLLKSASRAYIFQASISPADMAAALTSLRRLRADEDLRKRLWDTTRYMRQRFEEAGYDLGTGDGPIVTPHFSDKDKLYAIVQNLYQRGIQTSAVTYPIVESGRGRLRLICSAAHTKSDVDKTLEALIAAEREVDEQLRKQPDAIKTSNVTTAAIKDWAQDFVAYLKSTLESATTPLPDLMLIAKNPEKSEEVRITLKDGEVKLNDHPLKVLPTCSLLIKEASVIDALRSSDPQKLLRCISKGSCVLNGQTEPFIWFFARLAEQRKQLETVI
ncbi:amino acid adenylation domain-containing protein [Flavobacteriaceae bacterium M23B6Z8]